MMSFEELLAQVHELQGLLAKSHADTEMCEQEAEMWRKMYVAARAVLDHGDKQTRECIKAAGLREPAYDGEIPYSR